MKKLDQTFKINPLYETDSYKIGHNAMLAPGTTRLYGTWIPRSLKYMHPSITEVMSAGQQLVVRYLHSTFAENFFHIKKEEALKFVKDMSTHLGTEYDGKHFEDLWDLGYLPIRIKALPEGIFTPPNVPHMTFINTVGGYAWLTLFLETYISKLAWQLPTAATIAHKFRQNANEWVAKTDPTNMWLTDFMCHDFHSRGGNPFTSIAVGLGHAISNKGSDTLNVIPASRYYYDEDEDSMPIFSVRASEHSVSTTKIFTVGEQQMIADWLKIFPKGILSIVSDTFDLWKLITEYLPANKEAIMARDGKLVIRPDSGDPVDIICGVKPKKTKKQKHWKDLTEEEMEEYEISIDDLLSDPNEFLEENDMLPSMCGGRDYTPDCKEGETVTIKLGKRVFAFEVSTGECIESTWDNTINRTDINNFREIEVIEDEISNSPESKGVIELLWDIFGGTINKGKELLSDDEYQDKFLKLINSDLPDFIEEGMFDEVQSGGVRSWVVRYDKYENNSSYVSEVRNWLEENYPNTFPKVERYKVLDPHIGAIYGDSITLERQIDIYKRLESKGFAATNVVFGVGSYTYVYQTRDGCGWAAKGSWFEVEVEPHSPIKQSYNIYKDPVTDDGQKRSLRGLLCVDYNMAGEIEMHQECPLTSDHPAEASEDKGLLQIIYEDGKFYNQTTLTEIRKRVLNHK